MTRDETELLKHATPIAELKIRRARTMQAAVTWAMFKKVGSFTVTAFRASKEVSKRCAEL